MSGRSINEPHLCVGLLSGTSADAVDAAVVRITRRGPAVDVELLSYLAVPYPPAVRGELFALFEQAEGAVARLTALNTTLGELFAEAALAACERAGVAPGELFAAGSHGQTVWHQPAPDPAHRVPARGTLQLGEAALIAEWLGCAVVSDFRQADMAAGGQGAPLTPYFDWEVLRSEERSRAVQNIGGIGNVTYLPAGGRRDDVIAFDTGPGNVLIDGTVSQLTGGARTFDVDGRLAAAGEVDDRMLARLLAEPFLAIPPPKSTGRELFSLSLCRRLLAEAGLAPGALGPGAADRDTERAAASLIATLTAFTARTIADAYARFLPPIDEVIVGGGGSRNPRLMALLQELLTPVPVLPHEAYGIDGKAKEAMLFALLAHDARLGLPTSIPAATGARHAAILGKVSLPPPRS